MTAIVYFVVDFIGIFATDDPTVPLLKRWPPAWVTYWPKLFYHRGYTVTDRDLFVSLAVNTVTYAVIFYAITYFRNRHSENN